MADNQPACIARSCGQPAQGPSPYSGFALCEQHLAKEIQRLEMRQKELLQKLDRLANCPEKETLRLGQQALIVEIQEITDMFEAVQDRLQEWKDRLVSRVQNIYDTIGETLKDVDEAEKCRKEMVMARDSGQLRTVMEHVVSIEPFVDSALERSPKYEKVRASIYDKSQHENDSLIPRIIGDVSAGVQQLQFKIDKHFSNVVQQCRLQEKPPESLNQPDFQFDYAISGLPSGPRCVAVCHDTKNIVLDSSGTIIPANRADETCMLLPESCLFISFDGKEAEFLLVTSLNGDSKGKFRSEKLDWRKDIYGLHCDSNRQQLFLAQEHAVTVTDLCGRVIRVVTSTQLAWPAGKISGIACNSDKFFVLVHGAKDRKVHSISKTSGKLESTLDVSTFGDASLKKICLQEGKIWLADWASSRVLKVCSITGQLIFRSDCLVVGALKKPKGFSCLHLATDDRGLLFISMTSRNCVKVLTEDSNQDILECASFNNKELNGDLDCFKRPTGMIAVNGGTSAGRKLIVCDYDNYRLCVFKVC